MKNIEITFPLNTLDDMFRKDMEPFASSVSERIEALKLLSKNGIKTSVFLSPIFPEITDFKTIIKTLKNYSKSFWFENLNLYPYCVNKILKYIDIQDYMSKTFPSKNSKVTVLRDLNTLVKDAKINKIGKAKNITYSYVLPENLETINVDLYFKKDTDERVLKSEYFNFEVWDSFNNLLSIKEKEEIEKINEIYRNNKGEGIMPILIILGFLGLCGLAALGIKTGIFMFC
jgi:hypothetical protein